MASLTTATLKANDITYTLPMIEVPLNVQTIENSSDVTTLDMNVYTDFVNVKRKWTLAWNTLDEATYNTIYGIYMTQFTAFKYPLLSIAYYGIVDVPVRMTINEKKVVNVAGGVEGIEITLRETKQQ